MADCHHLEFEAMVIVNRLVDRDPDRPWSYFPDDCEDDGPCDRYMADIKIRCKGCKVPFAFKGLEQWLSIDHCRTEYLRDKCHSHIRNDGVHRWRAAAVHCHGL